MNKGLHIHEVCVKWYFISFYFPKKCYIYRTFCSFSKYIAFLYHLPIFLILDDCLFKNGYVGFCCMFWAKTSFMDCKYLLSVSVLCQCHFLYIVFYGPEDLILVYTNLRIFSFMTSAFLVSCLRKIFCLDVIDMFSIFF